MSKNISLETLRGQRVIDLLTEDRLLEVECFEKIAGKKAKLPQFEEQRTSNHRREIPEHRLEKVQEG